MEKLSLTVGFDAKRAVNNMTGLGNYSRLVVNTLSERYPDNRYVLLAPRRRRNPRLDPILERPNVEVETPRSFLMKKLPWWWRSVEMVHDFNRLGLDVFHGLSNEIPLTSRMVGCPTVVTIHDLIWRRFPSDYSAIDRWLYEFKYRRSAVNATRIIAISECTKNDIMSFWKIPSEKIDVIYQGCDPIFSATITSDMRADVRRRYNLPERYIISVGSVQGRKNQLLAVRALEALPDDVFLVIVGESQKEYGSKIERFIADHRLGERVIFVRGVPFTDLPALYSGALFSSYTSYYEGFGIPVVESLSVGTPVVAASGSCLEEAGGDGALYVGADSVEEYVEAARALIEKPWLREKLAAHGQRHIKRFSPADFATSIMKTYNKAILDFNLK